MKRSYTPSVMHNLLLVGGNGRNVGKTWFSCRIIEQLAKSDPVTAIKISSHFHSFEPEGLLYSTEHFIITREKQINGKDSSLMLQAGAHDVYFIMAPQKHLSEAFSALLPHLPDHLPIVCESGGLNEVLKPGVFFFVNQKDKAITKKHHLKHNPIRVTNNGSNVDFDLQRLSFSNKRFFIAG